MAPPAAAGRIVLSGCSGGGKSTLAAALAARGHSVVPEPGRRVIEAGGPRPDQALGAFLWACLDLALADAARPVGPAGRVFHDRSALDAVSGLMALGALDAAAARARLAPVTYADPVILFPPWEAIYVTDGVRSHGFAEAVDEARRLARDYPAFGHRCVECPCLPVIERVDWLLARLDAV